MGGGQSAKRYVPDWPGMDDFKGVVHHSSLWPAHEVDVRGKRCAVVGTGASGVQLVQAWAPAAGSLAVLQRTPNLALPMRRRRLGRAEQAARKASYTELLRLRERTFGGFHFYWSERRADDATAEERRRAYEEAWAAGGFRFWLAVFKDTLADAAANEAAYRFWAAKTRARLADARKRDLVAPLAMPHFFGVKRPCLEVDYYEQLDRPEVDVIDVAANPVARFTETGIELRDGTHLELDVVALATGFVRGTRPRDGGRRGRRGEKGGPS